MKASNIDMNPLKDASSEDAIGMLIADHKRVALLFAEFKRVTDEGRAGEKAAVVAKICQELTVHAQIEEELFYPALRKAEDEGQVDKALVEHAGAKQLIAQLADVNPDDDLYDAKVTVLGEQIDHHVEEEEGSMFPKARYSGLDTQELGAAMLARKSVLLRRITTRWGLNAGKLGEGSIDPNRESNGPRIKSSAKIMKKVTRTKAKTTKTRTPKKPHR